MRRLTSGPKPLSSRIFESVPHAPRSVRRIPVFHPVVPREIRRSLRRRYDVICRHRIGRAGQRRLRHDRAKIGKRINGPAYGLFNTGFYTLDEILLRHADPKSLDVAGESLRIVGHLAGDGCRVPRVVSRNGVEDERGVTHVLGNWADLVQRTGEGHETIPAHEAVGRFQTDDAAQRGRLPNAPARIGPK